jgi:hypothetical protein
MSTRAAWRTHPVQADLPNPMSKAAPRARFAVLVVSALGWLATPLGSANVHASNPGDFISEIITPAGWELQTSSGRCSWGGDLASSVEIITPEGWADDGREEPRWGGGICSELVVPAEWNTGGHYANSR